MDPAGGKTKHDEGTSVSLSRDAIAAIGIVLAAVAGSLQHVRDLRSRKVFAFRLVESGILSALLSIAVLAVRLMQRTRSQAAAAAQSTALGHLRRPPQSCAAP